MLRVSIGLCCSELLIDIKVVDVKLACIVVGFYSFSWNVCLKALSHEREVKKKIGSQTGFSESIWVDMVMVLQS